MLACGLWLSKSFKPQSGRPLTSLNCIAGHCTAVWLLSALYAKMYHKSNQKTLLQCLNLVTGSAQSASLCKKSPPSPPLFPPPGQPAKPLMSFRNSVSTFMLSFVIMLWYMSHNRGSINNMNDSISEWPMECCVCCEWHVCCSAIKEQEEQAVMARFQKRSSKLHHLLSTSAVAGIYRSPYQALTNTVPVLDKFPLEDQIRASRKSLVSVCCQHVVELMRIHVCRMSITDVRLRHQTHCHCTTSLLSTPSCISHV